jgi:hypothetical protein
MDLFQYSLDCLDAFLQAPLLGAWVGTSQSRLKIHLGHREALTDFIMEFARDLSAFCFLHLYETVRKHLQFLGGPFALMLPLFEGLGHLIERQSELPEFVIGVWNSRPDR